MSSVEAEDNGGRGGECPGKGMELVASFLETGTGLIKYFRKEYKGMCRRDSLDASRLVLIPLRYVKVTLTFQYNIDTTQCTPDIPGIKRHRLRIVHKKQSSLCSCHAAARAGSKAHKIRKFKGRMTKTYIAAEHRTLCFTQLPVAYEDARPRSIQARHLRQETRCFSTVSI